METSDIIRKLCKEKGIPISQLENELGYGNGSISKSKNMSVDRAFQIAKYFGVSVEYLMTGKEVTEINDEMNLLRAQQSILLEISKLSQSIAAYYKEIDKCQGQIAQLQQEYNQIELQKSSNKPEAPTLDAQDLLTQMNPMSKFFSVQNLAPPPDDNTSSPQ